QRVIGGQRLQFFDDHLHPPKRDNSGGTALPIIPLGASYLNSGSSSRESAPWCARLASPGFGIEPPPIKPVSETGWWGERRSAGGDSRLCALRGVSRGTPSTENTSAPGRPWPPPPAFAKGSRRES